MSNTCVNPIIYYWMNRKFRAYFNTVLFFIPRSLVRATPSTTRQDMSPCRLSRTQSCISRYNRSIPVRAMGLERTVSFEPGAGGYRDRRDLIIKMRSFDSLQSGDSLITNPVISEEFF